MSCRKMVELGHQSSQILSPESLKTNQMSLLSLKMLFDRIQTQTLEIILFIPRVILYLLMSVRYNWDVLSKATALHFPFVPLALNCLPTNDIITHSVIDAHATQYLHD